MLKKIITGSLFCALLIGFSGCFEEEMTCNNETAQGIVNELSEPTLLNAIFIKKSMAGEYGEANPLLLGMLSGEDGDIASNINFMSSMFANEKKPTPFIEDIQKNLDILKEDLKSAKFSIDSFMTTQKDKELGKVECSATAHYKLNEVIYDFDTTYTAQFTDNREQIVVELNSFAIKE